MVMVLVVMMMLLMMLLMMMELNSVWKNESIHV